MKRIILIVVLLVVGISASAQSGGSGTASSIYKSTFANLGTPVDGSVRYCTNCNANTSPCTSGGTGAMASRVAGAWSCSTAAAIPAPTPAGSNTQVQYNNAGAFGGISGLTTNGSTTVTQTSNSATAFESGPNGGTNPVLRLVNNTASQADGVSITGGAAGNGTTFTGLSSGSNAGFTFTPKGTGNFTLTSGDMALGTNRLTFSQGIIKSGTSGVLHARTTADTAYANFAAASFRANDSSDNATMTMNLSGSGIFATISSGGITWSNSATQSNSTIDTSLWRSAANVVGVGTSVSNTSGSIKALGYLTDTNCSDSAGAAACGSATAGSFVIDAATTSTVVSTTSVTANSQIFLQNDSSLGTRLSVTCNTQSSLTLGTPRVTARTAGTSFTATIEVGPTTNPMCLNYRIVN